MRLGSQYWQDPPYHSWSLIVSSGLIILIMSSVRYPSPSPSLLQILRLRILKAAMVLTLGCHAFNYVGCHQGYDLAASSKKVVSTRKGKRRLRPKTAIHGQTSMAYLHSLSSVPCQKIRETKLSSEIDSLQNCFKVGRETLT